MPRFRPAFVLAIFLISGSTGSSADDPAEIMIWPDGHPEPKVSADPPENLVKGPDGLTRRFNVSSPRLFVYQPEKNTATGSGMPPAAT